MSDTKSTASAHSGSGQKAPSSEQLPRPASPRPVPAEGPSVLDTLMHQFWTYVTTQMEPG